MTNCTERDIGRSQELEVSLHMALMDARQKRHEFITVEHLLLALLDNSSASEVLRSCAANIEELRKLLAGFINEHTPIVTSDEVDTQPTLGFQRVIQRATLHVMSAGEKEVTGANVLVAIFGEKDSHAVSFLHQKGVTRLDVVNYISHGRGGVQPLVNVTTIPGFGAERYAAVRHTFEIGQAKLEQMPQDPKGAVRDVFEAMETLTRVVVNSNANLDSGLVKQNLMPLINIVYGGVKGADQREQQMLKGAEQRDQRMAGSFAKWVEAAHPYARGQKTEEPGAPSKALAFLLVSQSALYIRWLVTLDQLLNRP